MKEKILTIGGGSGSTGVLQGLKKYDVDITAVVGVFDDGGSTGRLRRDYGVVAMGDLRQALAGLTVDDDIINLLQYRFSDGALKGHTIGNILLTSLFLLQREGGNIDINKVFKIKGRVLPISTMAPDLYALFNDGMVTHGQAAMTNYSLEPGVNVEKIYFKKPPLLNDDVKEAFLDADKIILCPGDLYGSLTPHFLVDGFVDVLQESKAQKIVVSNPVNKLDATQQYAVADFIDYFEMYLGKNIFDTVIYNTQFLDNEIFFKGVLLNDLLVQPGDIQRFININFIGEDLLGEIYEQKAGDVITRSPVRYDSTKLAQIIIGL